jgi:hypothetical protein
MTFIEWLESKNACTAALGWAKTQPDQSLEALWAACYRGDWMLWACKKAGVSSEAMAPVAYRAANRAVKLAITALDAAGAPHSLGNPPEIGDAETASVAAFKLRAAWPEQAQWELEQVIGSAAVTADFAGLGSQLSAVEEAGWAASATGRGTPGKEAEKRHELKRSADDCRALLPLPKINFD